MCDTCEKHYKHHQRDEKEVKNLKNRIHKMIGQLNGIERMLDDNRYCGDILVQVSAVEKALQSVGYIILKDHLETCVREDVKNDNEEIMGEVIELVKKLK